MAQDASIWWMHGIDLALRHILRCATFIVGMVPPANLDDLSHAELKNLVVALFEQIAELRRTIAAQAEEIARLKGGPRRPNIRCQVSTVSVAS